MMSVLARTGRSLVQGSKVARTHSVHSRCKYAGPRTTPSLKLTTATRTLLFANTPIPDDYFLEMSEHEEEKVANAPQM